jgi:hypothetical protein
MEYRWMSAPTPVTNMTIVIDSGSTRRLARTENPPAVIQSKPSRTTCR